MKLSAIKQKIIRTARQLSERGLLVANAGNISCRIDKNTVLITASGAPLGRLTAADLVTVDLETGKPLSGKGRPSSELALHLLVYKSFPVRFVVHCHPPLTNAYFCIYDSLKVLTQETDYYLGQVPLVVQGTVTVTRPMLLIRAFKRSSLVAVKNHGVFAIGEDPAMLLERIFILEEAVKVAAVARLFCKKHRDFLDLQLQKYIKR